MIALLSVVHVVDEGAQLLQLFGADALAADQRGEKLVRRTVKHLVDQFLCLFLLHLLLGNQRAAQEARLDTLNRSFWRCSA